MKTSEVLELAKAEVENGWCKANLQDSHGNVCAVGAVLKVCEERELGLSYGQRSAAIIALNKTTEELGWEAGGIVRFNNHSDTRQIDVVAVYEKTIARMQERGQ